MTILGQTRHDAALTWHPGRHLDTRKIERTDLDVWQTLSVQTVATALAILESLLLISQYLHYPGSPQSPINSARNPLTMATTTSPIRPHLDCFLTTRHPPKTFCPSEVARALYPADLTALNCSTWRQAMPAVRELVFQLRKEGECEVLQKGVVLGYEIGLDDVVGPIRVRRVEGIGGE
jgi:hypothetical protein